MIEALAKETQVKFSVQIIFEMKKFVNIVWEVFLIFQLN